MFYDLVPMEGKATYVDMERALHSMTSYLQITADLSSNVTVSKTNLYKSISQSLLLGLGSYLAVYSGHVLSYTQLYPMNLTQLVSEVLI